MDIVLISSISQVFSQQNGARKDRKIMSVKGTHSQSKFVEQFPTKSNSAWTYFSKPVVNAGLVKPDLKRMLTLAEVSDLFETYYACLENNHWTLQKDNIKKVFIKILEDVKEIGIDFKNKKGLNIFLQIRISTYSKSVDNILLDSALYKRYSPIVMDLINRKLWDKQMIKDDGKIHEAISQTKSPPKKKNEIK